MNSRTPRENLCAETLTGIIEWHRAQPRPDRPRERFPVEGCSAVVHGSDDGATLLPIDVRDLSFGGIAFETDEPLH